MTVKAIYENGVFRPIEPVYLPEMAQVEVIMPGQGETSLSNEACGRIHEILSRTYDTGEPSLAQDHDKHQP